MTRTGLRGPCTLENEAIDENVTETSAGAYALGYLNTEGAFVPKYVGRSDDDINNRLKNWVDSKHTHFKFEWITNNIQTDQMEPTGNVQDAIHLDNLIF